MNLLCYVIPAQIAPIPKEQKFDGKNFVIVKPVLQCTYVDLKECSKNVQATFDFYQKIMFPRNEPYTKKEFQKLDPSATFIIDSIVIEIDEQITSYDVLKIDEYYSFDISESKILIKAVTDFGVARALTSIAQLIGFNEKFPTNEKAYQISQANIIDYPSFHWRHLLVDAARHFLPISTLKKQIDALSITKMNLLYVIFSDTEAQTLKMEKAPQSNLAKGAWNHLFTYSMKELEDLQNYAITRGVIVFPAIDMPNHAQSWGKADPKLVANCPGVANNLDSINPIHNSTYDYIYGYFEEITQALFTNTNVVPIYHLGGDIDRSCWDRDAEIQAYLKQQGKNSKWLWKDFHAKVHDIIEQKVLKDANHYKLYFADVKDDGESLNKDNDIIHLTYTKDAFLYTTAGYRVVQSSNWYLDQMKPNGAGYYFYQDTWKTFYQQDLYFGLVTGKDLVLGGGPMMYGEQVNVGNIDGIVWPRAVAPAEILWSNPKSRNTGDDVVNRLEKLACKLYVAGVKTGTLTINEPCFGFPGN